MALKRCLQKRGLQRRLYQRRYKEQSQALKKEYPSLSLKSLLERLKLNLFLLGSVLFKELRFLWCLIYESLRLFPLWVYELFRFCPGKRTGKGISARFLIIGHRGAAAHEVENTLPSLQAALSRYDANALEIDLSFTRDKQVVLWHDWDPDSVVAIVRQAGLEPEVKYRPYVPMNGPMRKPVHQLTLDELRRHYGYCLKKAYPEKIEVVIPTFEEFMHWAVDQETLRCVFLDLKTPPARKELIPEITHNINTIVKHFQPKFELICLTPYREILQALKQTDPQLRISWDTDLPPGIVLDVPQFSSVQRAIEHGNTIASVGRPTILQLGPWTTYRRVVDYDIRLKEKHNQAESVPVTALIGWTINKRREIRCLLRMGMDGILSDRPERLREVFKQEHQSGEYGQDGKS